VTGTLPPADRCAAGQDAFVREQEIYRCLTTRRGWVAVRERSKCIEQWADGWRRVFDLGQSRSVRESSRVGGEKFACWRH